MEGNYSYTISDDEYEVIKKFLNFYKESEKIVADGYTQNFIKTETETIIKEEEINFYRKILHNGVMYVVELKFCQSLANEKLKLKRFRVIANDIIHQIDLTTPDKNAKKIREGFDIDSIFTKEKIIFPEEAYENEMHNNEELQKIISEHNWQEIDEKINRKQFSTEILYSFKKRPTEHLGYLYSSWGTILYQLIFIRMYQGSKFSQESLNELEKLIIKLSSSRLINIDITEIPFGSLLGENNSTKGSSQHTTNNSKLEKEMLFLEELKNSYELNNLATKIK